MQRVVATGAAVVAGVAATLAAVAATLAVAEGEPCCVLPVAVCAGCCLPGVWSLSWTGLGACVAVAVPAQTEHGCLLFE